MSIAIETWLMCYFSILWANISRYETLAFREVKQISRSHDTGSSAAVAAGRLYTWR